MNPFDLSKKQAFPTPAFRDMNPKVFENPYQRIDSSHDRIDGMTYREYVAALITAARYSDSNYFSSFESTARDAVKQADALIAELAK